MRMMMVAVALALHPPGVAAQTSERVPATEISALLSGDTALGVWHGKPYRQYFNPDGSTIYAEKGARSTYGRWRVDVAEDVYESRWPPAGGWESYAVARIDGALYWDGAEPQPFEMLEGRRLLWPEQEP